MIINIVAGGPSNLIPELKKEDKGQLWIGVDRGTLFLINHNINPDLAFGDFDSISELEFNQIKTLGIQTNSYQSEKDDTDLEIALEWAIKENPSEIRLYGVTGGRLDHELINIQMLKKGLGQCSSVTIIDKQNKVQLKLPGEYIVRKESDFPYISFLSVFEEVEGLTLRGFKYELDRSRLHYGSSLCISNELHKNFGTYLFTKGILMMIRSRDRFLG
jgi:thiamine pyrophosphokinase